MKYYEVAFSCTPDTQVVRDILMSVTADIGFESYVEDGRNLLGYIQMENYDKEQLESLLADFPIPGIKIE